MKKGKELEYPWITTLLHQHEESITITKDMVGDTMKYIPLARAKFVAELFNNDLIQKVKTLEKRITELEERRL